MAVGGIGVGSGVNTNDYYTTKAKTATETAASESASKSAAEGSGVVYEKSTDADNKVASSSAAKAKNVDHDAVIAKLKAATDQQTANLKSIVEKMLLGQSKASSIAGAKTGVNSLTNDDDMWKILASGKFEVDAATKAQAQADIADDGYWGVDKTSDRIVDFAKALAGNDPTKAQKLLDAFKEGYKKAEETWGGKLPDISSKTYEAVEKKFGDWMNEGKTTEVES